jgi:hypothetical protein
MTAANFPIDPGAARSYEVRLRGSELSMRFFRPVGREAVPLPDARDFSSNAALGRRRRWSKEGDGEDATQFFGISCFDSYAQALANARALTTATPRWSGIAEFTIDPRAGHTYANTFESGHWTAWGESGALLARVREVYPIARACREPDIEPTRGRSSEPASFKLVDGESSNTVAHVATLKDAVALLQRMVRDQPSDIEVLVLVALGKDGLPRESWRADYFAASGVA